MQPSGRKLKYELIKHIFDLERSAFTAEEESFGQNLAAFVEVCALRLSSGLMRIQRIFVCFV